MSTDPERATNPNDESVRPEGDDPLVERLRSLQWPSADEATRERALEQFRAMVRERQQADDSG